MSYSSTVLATSGLVSYWRLGDAGSSATDSQGTNTGTMHGTSSVASLLTTDTVNNSRSFNAASGDYVNIPDASSLDFTTQFSFEAWVNPASLPASSTNILAKANAYWFSLNPSNHWSGGRYVGGTALSAATTTTPTVGTTYHLVLTYSTDGIMRYYVNGSLVNSTTANTTATDTNTSALEIGSWDSASGFFNGTIDEVAVYNTALSAATIANHYAVGSGAAPVTAILDDFNRANATPPSASWTTLASVGHSISVISNQAGSTVGDSASYWNPTQFGPDMEAYFDVVTPNAGIDLYLRVQNPTSTTTDVGYDCNYDHTAGTVGISKMSGVTWTLIGTTASVTFAAGDSMWAKVVGNTISIYRKVSGGTTWTLLKSVTDSTITGNGYIGVESSATTARLDNFGGGTVTYGAGGPSSFNQSLTDSVAITRSFTQNKIPATTGSTTNKTLSTTVGIIKNLG